MKKILFATYFFLLTLNVVAQSPISFNAKAGVGIANIWGKNSEGDAKFAYKLGVGMEYAFNKTWALQPSLNFVSKGSKDEEKGVGKATLNTLYLELPIMAAARFSVNKSSNIVFTAGPYIAYGIGGKTIADIEEKMFPTLIGFAKFGGKIKIDTFGDISKGNMGCKRFDAGVGLGMALEYRKMILGIESQIGLINISSSDLKNITDKLGLESFSSKNISAFLTIGYKF